MAVFSLDPAVRDLRGGRQLPADPLDPTKNLVIDFDNFFSELPREADDDPALIGRAIDTKISPSLFQLPIPGAEGGGDNVLAFRNLTRAKFYDMPSGEAVAEAMGFDPLTDPVTGELVPPVFPEGTPLWFYILREAEVTSGGAELGPVGGGIVAEVFVDVMRQDNKKRSSRRSPVCRMCPVATSASVTCWLPPTHSKRRAPPFEDPRWTWRTITYARVVHSGCFTNDSGPAPPRSRGRWTGWLARPSARPADNLTVDQARQIAVTSSDSASDNGGSSPGRRWASIVLPTPGGPVIIR